MGITPIPVQYVFVVTSESSGVGVLEWYTHRDKATARFQELVLRENQPTRVSSGTEELNLFMLAVDPAATEDEITTAADAAMWERSYQPIARYKCPVPC